MRTLLALAAVLFAGCGPYHRTQDLLANGADHVLEFGGVTAGDLGVVPIGVHRTVTVERLPGGQQECRSTLSEPIHSDLRAQGGSIGHDRCTRVPADPVVFESAACDGSACEVSAERSADAVVLHLSGKSAATTRLHVVLKSTKDNALYADSIAVRFAPAARIRLSGLPRDLLPLRIPALPGISVTLPRGTVVDANDTPMSVDGGPRRLRHAHAPRCFRADRRHRL